MEKKINAREVERIISMLAVEFFRDNQTRQNFKKQANYRLAKLVERTSVERG